MNYFIHRDCLKSQFQSKSSTFDFVYLSIAMRQNIIKYSFLFIFIVASWQFAKCQEILLPKTIILDLCAENMQGRGYVKNGDKTAALYIKNELESYNVPFLSSTYFQEFAFPMNTFPGNMEIALDQNILKPVYDFLIAPESKSTKGTFALHYLPKAADTVDAIWDSIIKINYKGEFVVADFPKRNIQQTNPFVASGVVIPSKKFYWWASTGHYEVEVPMVVIADSLMALQPKNISVNFENKFIKVHNTQNVAGFVNGSENPDSFIVFTAHYDHLGCMGKDNIFRGANDNASGTAMVLCLANYFAKPENKPKNSIAFVFFAAEEAGLLGSSYFVDNPLIPLTQIKSVINLDMVGSGSEGISIVNGKTNLKITSTIQSINEESSYFSDIQIRDKSCNSDQCFFIKAGVPAVYIYTRGKECMEYHNLLDNPETLPLTKFNELQNLLIEFAERY